MTDMRLLVLSPYLPSPPSSGGAARIHGLLTHLAKQYEIHILAYTQSTAHESMSKSATEKYATSLTVVEHPYVNPTGLKKRLGQARSLLSHSSYERAIYQSHLFQQEFEARVAAIRPDVVLIEFAQMGFVRFPRGIPVVLDAHNVEHEILLRAAEVDDSRLRRLYARRNGAKLRRDESRLLQRVDAAVVTSTADLEALQRLAPDAEITVVPNGVSTDEISPRDGQKPNRVLFFGALDYFPNADGLGHFLGEIWPKLRARRPELEFVVVGREPPRHLKELNGVEGIQIVGFVDDIRPWIASAAVVIVPLRAGSGTRLKILEALAMARPVVTTSIGVEGLDLGHGRHLLIADDDDDFAAAVLALLEDTELAKSIGSAGRARVASVYDWSNAASALESVLRKVVADKRR